MAKTPATLAPARPEDEARQFGPAPYDPYDEEQGDWADTAEPEEQKMPVVVVSRRGRPAGGSRGSGKRGRRS